MPGAPPPQYLAVERLVYPELPPVSHPPTPQLDACKWEKPRLMNEWTIVHGAKWKERKCSDYDVGERKSKGYKESCLEHPIDTSSNIIYGYTRDGWGCFRVNMTAIQAMLEQYKVRLDSINAQRAEWIERNRRAREEKATEATPKPE